MHHLTIVVSFAPAGGVLAGGGCRDPEQGLRPGLRSGSRSTAARPRTRPGITSWPARAGESRQAAGGALVRKLSASSTASSSNAARTTCCSATAKPQTAHPSEGPPSAAGKPPTRTLGCWPASLMPRPSADASCGSKPPVRPGSARCSSTSRSHCPSRSRSSTPRWERMPGWPARPATTKATGTGPPWSPKSTT